MSGSLLAGSHPATVITLKERAYVFIAPDHCSSEFIGHHASFSATSVEALESVRTAVSRHMVGFGEDVASGLVLRHDNSANYILEELQSKIAFFGIGRSRPLVRQPQKNGMAERLIRTHQEQIMYGRVFASVKELPRELDQFAEVCNERWLAQKNGCRTPNQIRAK